jgi:hypothetical protein
MDSENGKSCVYADESIWKSDIQKTGASRVAVSESINGNVHSIDITQGDEAGDWMVFDHYSFAKDGTVNALTRKINIIPGDRSVDEVYKVQDGKLIKTDSTVRSLTGDGNPTTDDTWLPVVPMFNRLTNFPFASLLRSTPSQVTAAGRICTSNSDH